MNSLSAAIDESVARFSNKAAIICPSDGSVSFAEFAQMSAELSKALVWHGIGSGHRVVVFGKRSASVLVAMRATIMAGAAYVPVAHSMPVERVAYIIENCAPTAIICDSSTADVAKEIADAAGVLLLQFGLRQDCDFGVPGSNLAGVELPLDVSDEEPCYLLYTSGSTGHPKGVVVRRRNVSDYIDWANSYFAIKEHDRVLSTAPFFFDMSVFDIYASLTSGATLVIASETECLFPKLLVDKIHKQRITIWKAVSALFAHVAEMSNVDSDRLATLRTLIFSGERLPVRYLIQWMKSLPSASFYNAYGPTEATGISTCHSISSVPLIDDEIPIGVPCTNTEVLLFDGDIKVTGKNMQGEIVIQGKGVAAGYWADDDKTQLKFVNNIGDVSFDEPVYRSGDIGYWNDNGELMFVARMDRQVKHQGYRIELDDIESALGNIDGVKYAAVVQHFGSGQSELAGFFEGAEEIDDASIRAAMIQRLPKYMIPKYLVRLSSLPRSDRGKIDYAALRAQLS